MGEAPSNQRSHLPGRARGRRRRLATAAWALVAIAAVAAVSLLLHRPAAGPHRWLVIGLDGAEWSVVQRLWEEGALPHLKRLAETGTTAVLRTRYTVSPVIWTTLATGRTPREHGVTDFVVATPGGDVPVASTVRRVPALWNLLSRSGRRVAVLGWWATWPAEEVDGVVVSDRALVPGEGRISPPGLLPFLEAKIEEAARAEPEIGDGELTFPRDRLMTHLGRELLPVGFDLVLVYLHGIDTVSHQRWKYWEPEAFAGVDPDELARHRGRIPAVYIATDAAVGALVEAAGEGTNVIVLSDHGFHAAGEELVKVWCDFDAVLERLGYLVRDGGRVDLARSRLYTWATPRHQTVKKLRFALAGREPEGRVRAGERRELRRRLERDLARVTWEGGDPAFTVREAGRYLARAGADLAVEVITAGATPRLLVGGEPFDGAVERISRLSGTHGEDTHGIFLAAGPDVAPGADLTGISIHDVAPTLLYGLGLPVARDFAGSPRRELFTAAFRRANPLVEIATWGEREAPGSRPTAADEDLLDDLRALGYLP